MVRSVVRQRLQSLGLVEPRPSGSPWGCHPSQSSTAETKYEQVALGRVPQDNLTQSDTSSSPRERECLDQWPRSEERWSRPTSSFNLLCDLVTLSLPLSEPQSGQMMPGVPSSPGVTWARTELSWGTGLSLIFMYPFQTPQQ